MESLKALMPDQRDGLLERLRGDAKSTGTEIDCLLMNYEQISKLADQGHEIGSHTLTHPILPQLDDETLARELVESRTMLEAATGRTINGFCYPNGDFDERVVKAVGDAGYAYACSTRPGRNRMNDDPFRLKRIDVTASRVGSGSGKPDPLGFRSELCLFREFMRS